MSRKCRPFYFSPSIFHRASEECISLKWHVYKITIQSEMFASKVTVKLSRSYHMYINQLFQMKTPGAPFADMDQV